VGLLDHKAMQELTLLRLTCVGVPPVADMDKVLELLFLALMR